MAGHSKWANIRFRKAGQDAKRGKLFTKLIREITVTTKMSGSDPQSNPRLRAAIDKALAANMTKDTIERAIKRGSQDTQNDNYEEIRYEGYGPAGIALLIDCLSDNRNRTVGEVRHLLTKYQGNLGTTGSVAYQFTQCGVIAIAADADEDQVLELALTAGADDVCVESDGYEVLTSVTTFQTVCEALAPHVTIEHSEITLRPDNLIPVTRESGEKLLILIEHLEELDDVQNVYSNADIPAELLR